MLRTRQRLVAAPAFVLLLTGGVAGPVSVTRPAPAVATALRGQLPGLGTRMTSRRGGQPAPSPRSTPVGRFAGAGRPRGAEPADRDVAVPPATSPGRRATSHPRTAAEASRPSALRASRRPGAAGTDASPARTGAAAGHAVGGDTCGAALAYLQAHAAPGFRLECPGYALGHQAMTCVNVAGVCPGAKLIVIAVACPASWMNEASNSWVLSGLSDAPIDPYGYCH